MKQKIISTMLITALFTACLSGCSDNSQSTPQDSQPISITGSQTDSTGSSQEISSSKEETSAGSPSATPEIKEISESPVGDFEYEYDEELDGMVIKRYVGSDNVVGVPLVIEGKNVESIGYEAFAICSRLASVTIEDGVSIIGNNAFTKCECLTSVTIPDSITSIGEYTFEKCKNLTSVTYKGETYSYSNIDELYAAING